MMRTVLSQHYRRLLLNSDLETQRLAQLQLERLRRVSASPVPKRAPSRWAHVPLAALFADAGNRLHARGARWESGHEPLHGSKSGRCVLIDPSAGHWYCRSCRRGGDAATFVMDLRGSSYPAAVAWLIERYGSPERRDA